MSAISDLARKTFPDSPECQSAYIKGAIWMQYKAVNWFMRYLSEGGTIDDWFRDSLSQKNGRTKFMEAMGK